MIKGITCLVIICTILTMTLTAPFKAGAATEVRPVALKDVTYEFNDSVKFIDVTNMTRIGSNIKLPGQNLTSGDIIVDRKNQVSLKILKVNSDGTYVTANPTLIELFKEFKIPRQVIQPTAANITEYAVKGISMEQYAAKALGSNPQGSGGQKVMSASTSQVMNKIDNIFKARGSKVYEYSGVYEFSSFGFSPTANKVKLSLDGALGVSPGIVADYSLFGGYEFGFVDAAQFIKLNMMFDVKIDQEMYLPIFSITVPILKLGNVKLGVYLVVDVEGNITLTVKAEEGVIANASVYGGTSFGVPTSFHVNTGLEKHFGAECDPMGYIKAGLYITPLVSLEILDVDVFEAQVRLGFYGYANITEETMSYGVDFVVNAFVVILDDRTDLINEHIPIIERNKSFRAQDDVIFYFSRLCAYQDRVNVAAMTKRLSGSNDPNAAPFSDKLPFANRNLEIWYYKSGNDPQGGKNNNPNYKIPVKTDSRGCVGVDFKALKGVGYLNGVDVQKGDIIKIIAPGFIGETDLIKSVSPFGKGKQPGQNDFYGLSTLRGDFFENKVYFSTLSGWDLTGLDVPNTDGVEFVAKKRLYYKGPVKVYSTDKNTGVTETAWFNAKENTSEFTPLKSGVTATMIPNANNTYNVKPFNEMRWQIDLDGFIYGTYDPTGAGGPETTHKVSIKRNVEDKQVIIEDYNGNIIGIQHNIALHVIAINKGGTKPYTGLAKLNYVLGKVPADYVQTAKVDKSIVDIGYIKFPAANVRYPNHYEYYVAPPFPVVLYKKDDAPNLTINQANNTLVSDPDTNGTVSQSHYLWRWEELKPNISDNITVEKRVSAISVTGEPTTRTQRVSVANKIYKVPEGTSISEFSGVPISYTAYDPSAGKSIINDESQKQDTGARDIFQMRHIVSEMTLEGVKIDDPSFTPPQPIVKGDLSSLTPGDPKKFDIEFQLHMMKEHSDRFVVNPLRQSELQGYRDKPAVMKNVSVKRATSIKNFSKAPQWSKGYISAVINNNIMTLDKQGYFSIGKLITRAEFSSAIVNALGLSSADTVKTGFAFTDVSTQNKNIKDIKIAYQCGIIDSLTNTTLNPNALVTRQDAAVMLMKAFRLRNSSLIPKKTAGSLNMFSDKKAVSNNAVPYFEQAIKLGFMSSFDSRTLRPGDKINNEQAAKMLWELKLKAEKPGLKYGK